MLKTEYLQGDDVRQFMADGFCDCCLGSATDWAKPDWFGGVMVFGDYDRDGNLVGFLCPQCAVLRVR